MLVQLRLISFGLQCWFIRLHGFILSIKTGYNFCEKKKAAMKVVISEMHIFILYDMEIKFDMISDMVNINEAYF